MPTSPAGEPLTIHLPPADRAELDELARATERDLSALAAEAVAAYLEVHRWQADVIRRRMASGADDLATDEEVDAAFDAFGEGSLPSRSARRAGRAGSLHRP